MRAKMMELAEQMIKRAKKEVKEEERKQTIIQKFKEVFGFEPNLIIWTDNLTLQTASRLTIDNNDEEYDWTIEGRRVVEIIFRIIEEFGYNAYEEDWSFHKFKLDVICYQFVKHCGDYTAFIEIITN